MSDGISFRIAGAAELARMLERQPPVVARQIIRGSLRPAVEPWRDEMVARVRRGWHHSSRTKIKGQRRTLARRSREFGVIAHSIAIRTVIGAGGFAGTASVSPTRHAFWARFLEFGARGGRMHAVPFIQPAFEARKQDVLAAFIADVREQLRKGMRAP